jgi:hypothetical protein
MTRSNRVHRGAFTVALAALVALLEPAPPLAAQAPPATTEIDTLALGGAHGDAYHLLSTCFGLHATRCLSYNGAEIEAALAVLESADLTRALAAKYRQSRAGIAEAGRYYDQAQAARGRERSRLVRLGNATLDVARELLDAAVELMRTLAPQLHAAFQRQRRRGRTDTGRIERPRPRGELNSTPNRPRPPRRPKVIRTPFLDCLGDESDDGSMADAEACCEMNYRAGLFVLDKYGYLFTHEEKARILECLKATHTRCVQAFERLGTDFSETNWHHCFMGRLIFESPRQ